MTHPHFKSPCPRRCVNIICVINSFVTPTSVPWLVATHVWCDMTHPHFKSPCPRRSACVMCVIHVGHDSFNMCHDSLLFIRNIIARTHIYDIYHPLICDSYICAMTRYHSCVIPIHTWHSCASSQACLSGEVWICDSFVTQWMMLSMTNSRIWMSHITHVNESCHMYEWVACINQTHVCISSFTSSSERGFVSMHTQMCTCIHPHAKMKINIWVHRYGLTTTYVHIYLYIYI